jgi:uncharacterized protein
VSWFELPWQVIAWIVLVSMLAGYVQGLLGVGYPMLATPLLALFIDLQTAMVVTVPPVIVLSIYLIFRGGNLRASVGRFWYMPVCMIGGALVGAKIFFSVDASWLLLALGVALMMYVSLDWLGRAHYPQLARWMHPLAFVCAFAAGISESSINVGGPFLLIWCLLMGLAPMTMIQILNLCFLTGKLTQVAALTAGGVAVSAWLSALPLTLAALGPFALGIRMREGADVATYRRWLRTFLALMALLLVGRFLRQAWLA